MDARTATPPHLNAGTDHATTQTASDAISQAIVHRMRARLAAAVVPLFILLAALFLIIAITGI